MAHIDDMRKFEVDEDATHRPYICPSLNCRASLILAPDLTNYARCHKCKSEYAITWDYRTPIFTLKAVCADPVNHPSHYNTGKIEVIEFIRDQRFDYLLGNAVKYISRAGKKDPAKEVEDLEKARWYLNRKIEELKGEKNGKADAS